MPLGDLAAEARSIVLLGTPGRPGSLVQQVRCGLKGGRPVTPVSPALPLVPARKRGRPSNPPETPNTNKCADRQNRQTARYGTSTPTVRKDLVSRVRVESAEKGSKAWGTVAKQAGRDEKQRKHGPTLQNRKRTRSGKKDMEDRGRYRSTQRQASQGWRRW